MSNRELRNRALAIGEKTEGIIFLFLPLVMLSLISSLVDFFLKNIWGRTHVVFPEPFVNSGWISYQLRHVGIGPSTFFHFLVQCLTVTACFQLIRLVRNERGSVSFSDSFYLLDGPNFLPVVKTVLIKMLLHYFISLPLMAGLFILLSNYINYWIFGLDLVTSSIFLGAAFVFFGLTLHLWFEYSFGQVQFLLYDYLEMGTYSSSLWLFKKSWQLMKGNRWRLFTLDLSFLAWFIGVLVTFGLLGLYVFPYYWTCRVLFYEELKAKNPLVFSNQTAFLSQLPNAR